MPDPSPAPIDTIARAIFDTYVYLALRDGYGGKDLIATLMTDYGSCLNAARAVLAAMPQQPEPLGYGVVIPLAGGTNALERPSYETSGEAASAASRRTYATVVALVPVQPPQNAAHATNTTPPAPTAPPTLSGPQTATHDRWAAGYAAARRFYGDTAPLALDKIRDILADSIASGAWRSHVGCSGDPLGYFYEDLSAILDAAQEPHHD